MSHHKWFDHTGNFAIQSNNGVAVGAVDPGTGKAAYVSQALVSRVGENKARALVEQQFRATHHNGRDPIIKVLEGAANIRILGMTPAMYWDTDGVDLASRVTQGFGRTNVDALEGEGSGEVTLTFGTPAGYSARAAGVVLDFTQNVFKTATRKGKTVITFCPESLNMYGVRERFREVSDVVELISVAGTAVITVHWQLAPGAAKIFVPFFARPDVTNAVFTAIPEFAVLSTPVARVSPDSTSVAPAAREVTVVSTVVDGGEIAMAGWLPIPGALEYNNLLAKLS